MGTCFSIKDDDYINRNPNFTRRWDARKQRWVNEDEYNSDEYYTDEYTKSEEQYGQQDQHDNRPHNNNGLFNQNRENNFQPDHYQNTGAKNQQQQQQFQQNNLPQQQNTQQQQRYNKNLLHRNALKPPTLKRFQNHVVEQKQQMPYKKFIPQMQSHGVENYNPEVLKIRWAKNFKDLKSIVKDSYREVGTFVKHGQRKRGKTGLPINNEQINHLRQLTGLTIEKNSFSNFNDFWKEMFTEEKVFLALALHPNGNQHFEELTNRMEAFKTLEGKIQNNLLQVKTHGQ